MSEKPKRAPKPVDPVTKYARDVIAKRIVAGPHVRDACRRHIRDLKDGPKRGLDFRVDEVERVVGFFERVLCLEGGKPFHLQPWQVFIVGSLFGWHTKDGSRRFRTAYIETAKGQGKSPLAAGIGLTALCIDDEPAAEVYSAAVSRDQASIVFKDAQRMVSESAALGQVVDNDAHALSIKRTHSVMRALSSESRGLDGKRVHVALIDELHEHPSSLVVDKMRLGTKGRTNPLIIMITNAGYDRTSVCWREHEYSLKVAAGATVNDEYFAYVCALDEGDDYRDKACWPKTNPNLGVSVQERYLQGLLDEAAGMPSKLNLILRLNFCVWTESHTVWIPDQVWMENVGADRTFGALTPEALEKLNLKRAGWFGLDLAATSDFVSCVGVFPDDKTESYDIICRFWLCEEAFRKRAKMGREPYELWRDQGYITVTPGGATDYDVVERWLLAAAGRYDVREIVYDRYWASQLVAHLADALGEEKLVQFGQGTLSMSAPVNEIERLAARRMLRHGGHPVMRWQISNVAIAIDSAGNKKIDKQRCAEKVDGPVSLAEAIGRAMVRNAGVAEDQEDDYYADREVRFL